MKSESMESRYAKIKNGAGNVLFCPLNDHDGIVSVMVYSEDCVESEVVGRYAGRLKIVDAVA